MTPTANRISAARLATVLTALSMGLAAGPAGADDDFSMLIMDVFTITGSGTVLTGPIRTGAIEVGDAVCVPLKDGSTASVTVDGIEVYRKLLDRAEAGQMVGLLLQVEKDLVARGEALQGGCKAADDAADADDDQ